MNTFDDMKAVMDDMHARRNMLAEQMREFNQLQSEIQALADRAGSDPNAKQKLENLEKAFPQGFQKAQMDILAKVSQLEDNFKTLEQDFRGIGGSEKSTSKVETQPKKRAMKRYL